MNELKKYLTINSTFSAVSGASMLAFSNQLNAIFNITNAYVFPFVGINLLFFAAIVWLVATKYLGNKKLVNLISALDAGWVIGSAIIVLFGLFDLSQMGYILISVVAVWIAFLGYKQFKNN